MLVGLCLTASSQLFDSYVNGQTVVNSYRFTQALPIPTDSLIAYYPFNGNANDESGNGNNGTVYGAALTSDRFGNSNSAYLFTSNDTIVLQSTIEYNTDFTFGFWINATNLGTYRYIIDNTTTSSSLRIRSDRIQLISPGVFTDDYSFSTSTWYLILYEFISSTNTYNIYTNNNLEGTFVSSTQSVKTNVIGSVDLESFNGTIDDLFFYNRLLNSDEKTSIYEYGGWTP